MEGFFRKLGLMELDGYHYERAVSGGQAAALAIYKRSDGPTQIAEPAPERVAIKFLISPCRNGELETFRREAETLLMLRKYGKSPTVVKALSNVRSLDGLPVHYFLTEFVEGITLREMFEEDPLPWDISKAVDTLRRITMALIPVTASAQVHRDLHPGNIMCCDPVEEISHPLIPVDPGIRILDFGVGRNWLADQRDNWQEDRFRHPGAVSSWSPELLTDPSTVDSKHDVWALGNLFFRMITGEFPFYAENFSSYYDRVFRCDYNRELLDGMPDHIQKLVACMFEVEPRKRLSIGGLYKITSDVCEHNLPVWLEKHPALAELYFVVEGNIWTCPICNATSNPTMDSRCRACGRYVESFHLPF